jgi:hypothetical protein
MQDPAHNDPLLYQQGECNETSGFLFSHRCGQPALNKCVQCQKPICERHTYNDPNKPGEQFCTTCAKQFISQQQPAPGQTPYQTGPHYGGYGYGGYGYEPYFYTGYYYHGYPYGGYHRGSHSTSDFTDADERSLTGGEPSRDDARAFESDMGGS